MPPSKRGFSSLPPERQREIARLGGASVPPSQRSFSQDKSLASSAGRKGGLKRAENAARAKAEAAND